MQTRVLAPLGYDVSARTSSAEALEAFRASPDTYQLVISDMAMPHMAGDRLAEAIKSIRPDMPVILCTGLSEKLNRRADGHPAIDAILMKPLDQRRLAKTIRSLLDRDLSV